MGSTPAHFTCDSLEQRERDEAGTRLKGLAGIFTRPPRKSMLSKASRVKVGGRRGERGRVLLFPAEKRHALFKSVVYFWTGSRKKGVREADGWHRDDGISRPIEAALEPAGLGQPAPLLRRLGLFFLV